MSRLTKYLSQSTKAVLNKAQQYADNRHELLSTNHIAKALFEVDRTVAYDVLHHTHLTSLSLIRETPLPTKNEIPSLLEQAAKIAQSYSFPQIEPEHLLMAILDNVSWAGHQLLRQHGLSLKTTQRKLTEWMFGVSLIQNMEPAGESGGSPVESANPLTKKETPMQIIKQCTTDLTALAVEGKLDKVAARDQEIAQIVRTLLKRKKNNPLLIGDPGVGKTALVHGLAERIAKQKVPFLLQNKRLLELSVASLVSGTVYRGQFEERVKLLLAAIQKEGNIILFVDEIHTLSGAGSTEGALDLANILKPMLAQGDITIIGATTNEEYNRYFASDRALARRFQTHFLKEPDKSNTTVMVKAARQQLEKHHHIKIDNSIVSLVVELADRFLPDKPFPDKALDILDEAAASAQSDMPANKVVEKIRTELRRTLNRKYALIDAGELNEAIALRKQEQRLMKQLLTNQKQTAGKNQPKLTPELIYQVVSQLSGVPVSYVAGSKAKIDLASLTKTLTNEIVGQKSAINEVVSALGRAQAGFKQIEQPIASFIFIGPTGVGKTEVARVLAKKLFGSSQSLIKMDMSELSERHTISQLIGSPKGYVGHDDGGTLVEKVRKQPHSVILFDEIEKAHPDIFNLLLQILEDGTLTDTHDRVAHFRHSIIILTSNLGTDSWQAGSLGFLSNKTDPAAQTKEELNEFFRPELLARLTTIIQFSPFTKAQIKQLVRRRLAQTKQFARHNNNQLVIANKIVDWLAGQYNPEQGARSIDELVKRLIEDNLVKFGLGDRQKVSLNITKDQIKISPL